MATLYAGAPMKILIADDHRLIVEAVADKLTKAADEKIQRLLERARRRLAGR